MNVDAAVHPSMYHFGVGLVERDSDGAVLCVEGKYLPGSLSPLLAELIAIRTEISRAISMGWSNKFLNRMLQMRCQQFGRCTLPRWKLQWLAQLPNYAHMWRALQYCIAIGVQIT